MARTKVMPVRGHSEKTAEQITSFIERRQDLYHQFANQFKPVRGGLFDVIEADIRYMQNNPPAAQADRERLQTLQQVQNVSVALKNLLSGNNIEEGDREAAKKISGILDKFKSTTDQKAFEELIYQEMDVAKKELEKQSTLPSNLDKLLGSSQSTNTQFGKAFHELNQYIKKNGKKHASKWIVRALQDVSHKLAMGVPKDTDTQMVAFLETYSKINVVNLLEDMVQTEAAMATYQILDEAADIMKREGAYGARSFLQSLLDDSTQSRVDPNQLAYPEIRRYGISNTVLLPGTAEYLKEEAKRTIAVDVTGHMIARMDNLQEEIDDLMNSKQQFKKDKKHQKMLNAKIREIAKEKGALEDLGAVTQAEAEELNKRFAALDLHYEMKAKKLGLKLTKLDIRPLDIDVVSKHLREALAVTEEDVVEKISDNYQEFANTVASEFGLKRREVYEGLDEYFTRHYAFLHVLRRSNQQGLAPNAVQINQVQAGP